MISTTSKYALRALVYLGTIPRGTPVVSGHLAQQAGIPPDYLYKILLDLRNAGILDSSRGLKGGYRLRKKPEKIKLIEIISLFDGPSAEPSCLLGEYRICSDDKPCSAHSAWRDVRIAYTNFLKNMTIASIAGDQSLFPLNSGRKKRVKK
ncbi:MAG: Rrf2 family transcriptional regulator [candidate division Zixibacteria bacterium]